MTTEHEPGGWEPVTVPARSPEPDALERVEFDLSDTERAKAAQHQAQLIQHRNAPMKRGH